MSDQALQQVLGRLSGFEKVVLEKFAKSDAVQQQLLDTLGDLTRDVKGLYGHVDHLYKHVDGLYAHTEDLARDVKGLYGHTEELSHQYGVRRVEHSHLHSWVSSLAEDMTIVKRKLSL